MKYHVATIETDSGSADISIEATASHKWEISAVLPNGKIEYPEIPAQNSEDDAIRAIESAYYLSDWRLTWIERG